MQRACWCLTINPGQALYPRCNVPSAGTVDSEPLGTKRCPQKVARSGATCKPLPHRLQHAQINFSTMHYFAILYIKLNARVILSRKYITSDGKG